MLSTNELVEETEGEPGREAEREELGEEDSEEDARASSLLYIYGE